MGQGAGKGAGGPGGKVMATVIPRIDVGDNYKEKYGFFDPEKFVFKAKRGLNPEVVKEISWMKNEPEWMTAFRLKALKLWDKKEMPTWAPTCRRSTSRTSITT